MPTISMADKDFAEWYKNYVAEGQSVSLWEQALTGLQEAYKPQISAVQQTSAYDISQAYANYKKSQLNLLQSQQLGTGLKEQLSSGLSQQYQSAYQQAKTTEAQQLASLTGAYVEDVSTIEEQFSQFGETASQLQKALFEYASSGAGEIEPSGVNYDYQRAFIPESEGGLGYYSLSEDGTYKLTAAGEAFYDKLLGQYTTTYKKETGERVTTGFGDWLLENKDYAELGKAYAENPALFAEAFGDKRVKDLAVSIEETQLRRENQIKEALGTENAKTEINNLRTELESLEIVQDANSGAYVRDPASLKSNIASVLNIADDAVEIGWLHDNSVSRTKEMLRIDVSDKNLTDGQRFALEDLGFRLIDENWRFTKLSNTGENINEFFAR